MRDETSTPEPQPGDAEEQSAAREGEQQAGEEIRQAVAEDASGRADSGDAGEHPVENPAPNEVHAEKFGEDIQSPTIQETAIDAEGKPRPAEEVAAEAPYADGEDVAPGKQPE